MKAIGWVASVFIIIILVMLIIFALFSLALDGKQTFYWLCGSILLLLTLLFFSNPMLRSGTGTGRLKPWQSATVIVVCLTAAITTFTIACNHVDDDDQSETASLNQDAADDDSGSTNSTTTTHPAPVGLSFFECSQDAKNDRKMTDIDDGDGIYDSKDLKVFGQPVAYAEVSKSGSEMSRAVLISTQAASLQTVAASINAKFGYDACEIDNDGNQCVISNDDNSTSYQRMKLFLSKKKDYIVLQCFAD